MVGIKSCTRSPKILLLQASEDVFKQSKKWNDALGAYIHHESAEMINDSMQIH